MRLRAVASSPSVDRKTSPQTGIRCARDPAPASARRCGRHLVPWEDAAARRGNCGQVGRASAKDVGDGTVALRGLSVAARAERAIQVLSGVVALSRGLRSLHGSLAWRRVREQGGNDQPADGKDAEFLGPRLSRIASRNPSGCGRWQDTTRLSRLRADNEDGLLGGRRLFVRLVPSPWRAGTTNADLRREG